MSPESPLPPVTPIPLGRYRHYKGNEYEVIGVARYSQTLDELAVYRAMYGEGGLWVRPRTMFQESLLVGGKCVPRSEPIILPRSSGGPVVQP